MRRWALGGKIYWGATGSENSEATPTGQDDSDSDLRDDDPHSGSSPGVIYDLDSPGYIGWVDLADTIRRCRLKFQAYAWYECPEGTCRVSPKLDWYTAQSYKKTGTSCIGAATGGSASTLVDGTQQWAANRWAPGVVYIYGGTGQGQRRRVTVNDGTTITISPPWTTPPGAGSQYEVIDESTTWTEVNDVEGDNRSEDGTTETSWNLE